MTAKQSRWRKEKELLAKRLLSSEVEAMRSERQLCKQKELIDGLKKEIRNQTDELQRNREKMDLYKEVMGKRRNARHIGKGDYRHGYEM